MSMLVDLKKNGSIVLIITSLLAIFISGIFFGIFYMVMEDVETAFLTVDCTITDNVYFTTCQEMFDISVYPFLALRTLLVWMSYFFIFAYTLGMLVAGYQSGKNPVLLGLLVVFVIATTYFSIEIANSYRLMLDVPAFMTIVQPFPIYNKIMLAFPWFAFITGLFSTMLGVVNYQKTKVNQVTAEDLSY